MATTAPAVPATALRLASPTVRSQLEALPGTIRLGRAGTRVGERRTRRAVGSAAESTGETTRDRTRANDAPRNARMRETSTICEGCGRAQCARPLCLPAART